LNRRLGLAACAALAAAIAVFLIYAMHERDAQTSLVHDNARLMTNEERERLSQYHSFLIDDYDIDYRVITSGETIDINNFAVKRFEQWFARSRSKSGRGLLLVVDPVQDVVRLEVAYSLEGVFPDAFVAYVESRQMVPFFRTNRIADGILAATELIVTRAQRAAANAGFETEVWATASGGGGAVAPAEIGQGPKKVVPVGEQPSAAAANTPAATLQAYFNAMGARNANPDLALYTPNTRRMLGGWTITAAQMDSVVKTYRSCTAEPAKFATDGQRAVIRYPIRQRPCAPFFFEKIEGAWALDLTMMQRAIRFGRTNAWRFDLAAEHPYAFAFADWRFDQNGFPAKNR
jgi:uncharacterized protein